MLESEFPVSLPIGPTLEMGVDLVSHIVFLYSGKGTHLGLGLSSVKSFQTEIGCGKPSWHLEQLKRDALWDPAIHSSHTLHCHSYILDNTTTPCLHQCAQLKSLLGFPCRYVTKGNTKAVAYENSKQTATALLSSGYRGKK